MKNGMPEKDLILDAYAQALLAAKSKGMDGDRAKTAARNAAARAVSKAIQRPITPDYVAEIVARF
ncbi:hypothetical protein M2352_001625 [Azospirillum fermentarium]|uniref:hypothetical protein n=1 Tax=Azospirillum fermentarium TaxID=1233114 RepID=UPI002225EDC3|nr:hypothetical protein [Azospirillum fermentarium]MCW2246034.1 hypothetical protein [Azospirillum fermentarium]